MLELKSVGCVVDGDGYIYAQFTDGTYDQFTKCHFNDVTEEFKESLSEYDKMIVMKIIDNTLN